MKKAYIIGIAALVVAMALVLPAMAITSENAIYTSKYAAIDNSVPNVGYLYIALACQNNIYSKEAIIQKIVPNDPSNPPAFVNGGYVLKDAMDAYTPVGEPVTVTLNWAGGYDTEIAPGLYFITLPDGVGGLPEYRIVEIAKGYRQDVIFVGHVISTLSEDKVIIEVTKATYGAQEVVVDQEAYDETVYTIVTNPHNAYTGYATITNGKADFVISGVKYKIAPHYLPYAVKYKVTTVHHAEVTHVEGTYVDVAPQLQDLVKQGHTKFIFDNAQNPGGIFDTDGATLLTQITDPAPGIVKSVYIEYTVNGVPKTIDTDEYELISL